LLESSPSCAKLDSSPDLDSSPTGLTAVLFVDVIGRCKLASVSSDIGQFVCRPTSVSKLSGNFVGQFVSADVFAIVKIDRLFNGTSTQKGQFVPTVGAGNRLSRQRMANEIIQYIIPHVTR